MRQFRADQAFLGSFLRDRIVPSLSSESYHTFDRKSTQTRIQDEVATCLEANFSLKA